MSARLPSAGDTSATEKIETGHTADTGEHGNPSPAFSASH